MSRFAAVLAAALLAASPLAAQRPADAPAEAPADAPADAPAARRLRELAAVLESDDAARMAAYVRDAYAPDFLEGGFDFHVGYLLTMARQGTRTLRGVAVDSGRARAALANTLTEEIDTLMVAVEPAPPHRIVGLGLRNGAGGPLETRSFRTDAERAAELDRYVRRLAAADAFSGVALFAKNGRPLYFEAFGEANRDFGVPVNRGTRFNLGSANKNFTAVVIGQLVEEGRLSWDDPLAKFLPDFPDSASAAKIRIHHLLTHTAGLGSYFNQRFRDASRARWRTVDDWMTLARPDSLRFEPGTDWAYSNTGYMVLGKVIEVVTGKDYFDVVRERIYARAGMTSSDAYDLDRVNPNLAVGYLPAWSPSGAYLKNNLFEHVIRGGPAGGGYATAEDLLRYAEALRGGRLISRATLELMRSPKPELASPDYGYGFVLFEAPDIWGHGGDFEGVDADLNQYGDSGYTLVLLANYHFVNDPIKRKVRRMMEDAGAIKGGAAGRR